jgi:hypothetical protein
MTLFFTIQVSAESKRIEVYPLTQQYWDINAGDTLGSIVNSLMPANQYLQEKLMREIIALNPEVFPEGQPDRMLANKRLWLPNAVMRAHNTDLSDYIIENYQWGSIRKNRDEERGTRGEDSFLK